MQVSPKQILRMAPNKVDDLIPGGEMINEFLGSCRLLVCGVPEEG